MVFTKYKDDLSYELSELLNSAEKVITIKKGSYLFQEGQPAKEMYIVLSGKVQISKTNAEGNELSLRLCSSNDIVGELTLFTQDPRYIFNAKVIENGEVAVMNLQDLERALFKNAKLAAEFLKWMNDHIRKTVTKFRDLVLNGKKGALYSTLIRLCHSYGVVREDGIQINIPLTNQDLANFCGTARESVSRMLADLRKANVISVNKKIITVHNIDFIKKEIDCENCPIEFCNIE
ncbi:Crp/Fnr family transcriptional regulator [Cytobacillus sp. FJAT-54145]|uniref:Crp/Fnr family transcriptional regulator n=1 Tax=Cytobacillus spartinae TaxID=3299023 RepID=A0ABW6K5M4_9BACI